MKIATDYQIKRYRSTINVQKPMQPPVISQRDRQLSQYNPVYYKPISFQGSSGFEAFFPTDILNMSEERFDKVLLNVIENPAKRDALAEYVTNLTAKDNQTMNFINMWKRQVPTLISQGLLTTMPANASDFMRRVTVLGSKNTTNSTLNKFLNSDYQTDILIKDAKSATAGVISWKLFAMANLDPDPYTKTALYLAAISVGAMGYAERTKDTQKIQNKQFLDALKQMMKIGVLDPYLLVNYADKTALKLSKTQEDQYLQWKKEKIIDIRYQKSGLTVDNHNDFDVPEARNALLVMIETLKELGFNDEKVAVFLEYYASTYDSLNESLEAEYLTRMALKIKRETDSETEMDTLETLGYLCEKNQKYHDAISFYDDAKTCGILGLDPTGERRLHDSLNMLDIKLKLIDKYKNIDYLLREDLKISKSAKRKEALEMLFDNSGYNYYSSGKALLEEDELIPIFASAKKADISEADFKRFLVTLSKYHIKSTNYKPVYIDNWMSARALEFAISDDCDFEDSKAKDIAEDSMKFIQEKAESFERKLLSNSKSVSSSIKELAQLRVGANLVRGNLEPLINNILHTPNAECTDIDAEILKIIAENIDNDKPYAKFNNANYGDTPTYQWLLQKRVDIIRALHGYESPEFYKALYDLGMKIATPETIIYRVIPILQNAPQHIQNELLPDLYAQYGKYKYYQVSEHPFQGITDKEALDIIVAYVKYFEGTKKIDQTKLMEFLKFLEDIYTKKPTETCEAGLGYVRDVPVFNVPLFDSINKYNNDKEFKKYNFYTSWGLIDYYTSLESFVHKAPGIFRVNERKFLDMTKKFESVIFQKRFNNKMDREMIAIENNVELPKMI